MTEEKGRTLEQILADERGQAAVLRHNGHVLQAEAIERVCDRVAKAQEDYLTWISEHAAALRSGKSLRWLRSRFPQWERQGYARHQGRERQYRRIIVPKAANLANARQSAIEAARRLA